MFCGQEVGNVTSFASSRAPSDHTSSSLFVKGVARNGSPPWREDDKDGHYMFALGDNITSRCNYTFPPAKMFSFFYSLDHLVNHIMEENGSPQHFSFCMPSLMDVVVHLKESYCIFITSLPTYYT